MKKRNQPPIKIAKDKLYEEALKQKKKEFRSGNRLSP